VTVRENKRECNYSESQEETAENTKSSRAVFIGQLTVDITTEDVRLTILRETEAEVDITLLGSCHKTLYERVILNSLEDGVA
jgi:hypothetical protein